VLGPAIAGLAAPAIAGYSLACADPRAMAARCSASGFAVREVGGRHAVSLPPALGGTLVFG